MTSKKEPLNITTQHYFFKPMCAYFYSFTLRAYGDAGCRFVSPTIDLGCNDGTFGTMLASTQDQPVPLIGVDIDMGMLKRAKTKRTHQYSLFIHSDATNLPFADGSISTIFCNYVFPSIKDLPAAIREIKRVLTVDGHFYCTVQTNLFRECYLISRLLRNLSFERAAKLYMDRVDRRFRCVNVTFSHLKWIDIFTEGGLRVNKIVGFFPLKLMTMWSFLAWTPIRIFGFLQLLPLKIIHRMSTYFQRQVFTKTYLSTPNYVNPEQSTLILICASK